MTVVGAVVELPHAYVQISDQMILAQMVVAPGLLEDSMQGKSDLHQMEMKFW